MQGWIKLHRKLRNNPIFNDPQLLRLWIICLTEATHKEHEQIVGKQTVKLLPGQFVTGRFDLMEMYNNGLKNADKIKGEKTVFRWLELLEKGGFLTINKTNKFSVVSIDKWAFYQGNDQENDQEMTNKRPSNDQQMTTNKNVNNGENGKEDKKEIPYVEIVDYLNSKAGTKYKHTGKKTKDLIAARWNEKFVLADFQTVIDKKTAEWLSNPDMNKYLRPETLFGTRFESYLNQIGGTKSERNTGSFGQTPRTNGRQYDIEPPKFDYKQR
jgi:uncharacterized phage protein (TIGR02220 family)